jgi:hypothetical protein
MASNATRTPPDGPIRPPTGSGLALDLVLGLAGAIAGGVAGYYVFAWIASQGFYAIMLPGAFVGWGCGALSGRRSVPLAVVCSVLGLAVGIYSEWRLFPFAADEGPSYFLAHLHQLTQITQVLILLGAVCAAWFGLGRPGGAWPRVQQTRAARDENTLR